MKTARILLTLAAIAAIQPAAAQDVRTVRAALVALTDDAQVRADFEDGLAVKAIEHGYDAVASHSIVPDVGDIDNRGFVRELTQAGVGVVLMMRPAAVGSGSSLESVRNAVSPNVYANMRDFAREISPSAGDDLFAVIHLGIYLIDADGAEPLSAGAVWLEEEVESQEEAIDLLQDLVLANVDAVRAPIREHLGLPPLQP